MHGVAPEGCESGDSAAPYLATHDPFDCTTKDFSWSVAGAELHRETPAGPRYRVAGQPNLKRVGF